MRSDRSRVQASRDKGSQTTARFPSVPFLYTTTQQCISHITIPSGDTPSPPPPPLSTMPRRRRPPRPGALADLAPLRIIAHIFALQAFYYGVGMILIVFTTIVAGRHPNAGLLLDWHNLRGDVTTGWTLGLCWMLDSLITYTSLPPSSTPRRPC